jgi:polyhydroxyalkanoate synthesis regulator phasin
MKLKQLRGVSAAVAGALLMGFGANAMDALVKKGVLTEEEALPLMKGRENDIQAADKKVKKAAKLQVSDVIDNATLYGDIRARYEYRSGEDTASFTETRDRARYKLAFGVKTTAGDFYSDLAFAMGEGGRSDNATFGAATNGVNGSNTKERLFVKRAMLGWNITDWVTVEAGRIANPLYTTQMVWDGDLTFEGLAEKFKYNIDKTELFANLVQSQYLGDYRNVSTGTDRITNNLLAFQGGTKFPITDLISGKVALTYTTYTNNKSVGGAFVPGVGTATGQISAPYGTNTTSTNDLRTIEIPGEVEFKTAGNLSYKVFGDYVYNLDGSDRFNAAVAAGAANATAIRNAGNDDSAWLLGAGIQSAQDKKPSKGDWDARVWYQDVGTYALDPNAVDSDFMDSRVNMKGIVFKGQYFIRSNVFANLSAGHATRKNDGLAATGSASDVRVNLDKYDLIQLDVTYKF